MKKSLGHTVSVYKGTNKVISSSDADWSGIKPGSYFKLNRDNIFYIIADKKPVYFIKDFEVENSNIIKINSNVGPYLGVGDILIISYKEYELFTLINIVNGGGRYKADDIVTVNGGAVSVNIETGLSELTTFIVNEVDNEGRILSLGLHTRGKYIDKPGPVCQLIDGSGEGAVIEVEYNLIDNRVTCERAVQFVKLEDKNTLVNLDAPLPKGLKNGKLSVEKWEIILNQEYLGETAINEYYQLCRDFTPYYRLPLAGKGSLNYDVIYNQSIVVLDDLIGTLEDRVLELENKIKELSEKKS